MNRKFYEVQVIDAGQDALRLGVDGQILLIAWRDCSASLAAATRIEQESIEIAPSGYGLHWPLLDEDLAIGPLLTHAQVAESLMLAAQ